MTEDLPIDLTPSQADRISAFAKEQGLTIDQAVTKLAREAINERYVLPKNRGSVLPMRALKRAPRGPSHD